MHLCKHLVSYISKGMAIYLVAGLYSDASCMINVTIETDTVNSSWSKVIIKKDSAPSVQFTVGEGVDPQLYLGANIKVSVRDSIVSLINEAYKFKVLPNQDIDIAYTEGLSPLANKFSFSTPGTISASFPIQFQQIFCEGNCSDNFLEHVSITSDSTNYITESFVSNNSTIPSLTGGDAIKQGISQTWEGVVTSKDVKRVVHNVQQSGKNIEKIARDVGHSAENLAKNASKDVEAVARNVGHSAENVAKNASKDVEAVARNIGRSTENLARSIRKFF